MQLQVHYKGLNHSRWMDEFITKKVKKLERYLGPAARVQVFIKAESQICLTTISIHKTNHDFAFTAHGENLYEAFSSAMGKANRALSEDKRKFKDRISRRTSVVSRELAA